MLIHWEYIARTETSSKRVVTYRSEVPGGWLVAVCTDGVSGGPNVLFYPDPDHAWGKPSDIVKVEIPEEPQTDRTG